MKILFLKLIQKATSTPNPTVAETTTATTTTRKTTTAATAAATTTTEATVITTATTTTVSNNIFDAVPNVNANYTNNLVAFGFGWTAGKTIGRPKREVTNFKAQSF